MVLVCAVGVWASLSVVKAVVDRSAGAIRIVAERPVIQRDSVETILEQKLPVLPASQSGDDFYNGRVPVSFRPLFSDFRFGMSESNWLISTSRNIGESLYVGPWLAENVDMMPNGVALSVGTESGTEARPGMASVQTTSRYGFGRYEAIIRAAKTKGVVTSFFVSTGPVFGTAHDEIDVEILGGDTRKVQLHYYKNGALGESKEIQLPFDASQDMYHFAFEWYPDRIIWFVDGIEIHRAGSGTFDVPQHAGRINLSTWAGTERVQQWLGSMKPSDVATAEFGCVSFTPHAEEPGKTCSDLYFNQDVSVDLASRSP